MNEIEKMILESKDKDAKLKLKLANYLYSEIKNDENAERLDEFVILIKDSLKKDKPVKTTTSKKKFSSQILQNFYDWLLSAGLVEPTCYDYCRRLIRVINAENPSITIEDLAYGKKDIQELIDKYSRGGTMWDVNVKQHNSPLCALKKFKEFLDRQSLLPGGTPKNADLIPYIEDDDDENCSSEDERLCDGNLSYLDESDEVLSLDDEFYHENDLSNPNFANATIFLRETEGDMPFTVNAKHCSEITIHNQDCIIIYKENGKVCDKVNKVVNNRNYAALIRLMRKYYNILNMDRTPATVAAPFGGVHTYEYEFEGKSNYSRSHKLFDNRDRYAVEEAREHYNKIIANIINQ
ncbi:MAG: hypothetical protein K2J16_00420 [Clostridia bacterium]|nr:hypothetical protein [Clostridia bacterium]